MCFLATATEYVHVLEFPKDHAKGHMIKRQTVTVDWPLRSHGICGGRRGTGTVFSASSSVSPVSIIPHSPTECNDSILKYSI
jgi:hypothetical protein